MPYVDSVAPDQPAYLRSLAREVDETIFYRLAHEGRMMAYVSGILQSVMGLLDFTVENSTQASRPWKHGQDYWASFELYPEWKGSQHFGFRGMAYHQQDYWSATEVAVKCKRQETGTVDTWQSYLQSSTIARKMAREFNELFGCASKIIFVVPTTVAMDKISDVMKFTRFFMRFDKAFSEQEVVIFEELIDGTFQQFTSVTGEACNMEAGNLDAFAHFTYHATNGQMVVCNLKGAKVDDQFKLTCPVVHSVKGEFGSNDKQDIGIHDFFNHHVCTGLCKNFLKPGQSLNPSAPPMGEETRSKSLPSNEDNPQDRGTDISTPPPYNFNDPLTPPSYESCINAG